MAIVDGPHLAALAHQQRVLGACLAVARHRIPGPFEVAQRLLAGVAFVQRRALDERVREVVGREDRGTAWPRVDERRLDGCAQFRLRRHVGDAVVGEDRIEQAAEPQRPHVARTCSHSGLRARLSASIGSAMSVSVQAKRALR